MPFIIGGAISAGGSLLSGILGAGAAKSAASQQAAAQDRATQALNARFSVTQNTLSPFTTAGANLLPAATSLALSGPNAGGPNYLDMASSMMPGGASRSQLPDVPFTQSDLELTPGYQFTLGQGLKAVQNSAAARGLGVSGAAMKGAAQYATGLADSTYQNQFNNMQQRYQDVLGLNTAQQGNVLNAYNRLMGMVNTGESAGAQTGQIGASLGNATAQTIAGAGAANAAGTIGAGNALSQGIGGGIGGIGSNITTAALLNRNNNNNPLTGPGTLFGPGGLFGPSAATGGFSTADTLNQVGLPANFQVPDPSA